MYSKTSPTPKPTPTHLTLNRASLLFHWSRPLPHTLMPGLVCLSPKQPSTHIPSPHPPQIRFFLLTTFKSITLRGLQVLCRFTSLICFEWCHQPTPCPLCTLTQTRSRFSQWIPHGSSGSLPRGRRVEAPTIQL